MGEPQRFTETTRMRAVSVAVDALLAVACYLLAYRLRFGAGEFERFLPSALDSLPMVAGAQVIALLLSGAYSSRRGRVWLPRLTGGIASGTAVGAALTFLTRGFTGISRASFVVDALLLVLSTFVWRASVGLWRLFLTARDEKNARGVLEDRTGPATVSAGLLGILHYRELVRNLVLRDLKLKYRGSVFGFMWSLVNPLLMIAVYTVAFTWILRIRTEGFVFFILLGVLAWTFFANSSSMSTGSVIDSAGLVKSVAFPRAVLPLSTVLFNFSQFALTLAVFLPLAHIIFGLRPTPAVLLFPLFLALQVLFTIGVALTLATATAFFRDVRHLVEVGLGALFWSTPILYQYRQVPEALQLPVLLSPMSPFIVAYQQIFYYGESPDLAVWLTACCYGLGMFVIGASVFTGAEDRLAEQL